MSKVGIMATTDQHANIITTGTTAAEEQQEREVARKLAERYRYAFIDLREQRINPELIRTISADLMFRYNFVPLETHNNVLTIAAADPGLVRSEERRVGKEWRSSTDASQIKQKENRRRTAAYR